MGIARAMLAASFAGEAQMATVLLNEWRRLREANLALEQKRQAEDRQRQVARCAAREAATHFWESEGRAAVRECFSIWLNWVQTAPEREREELRRSRIEFMQATLIKRFCESLASDGSLLCAKIV